MELVPQCDATAPILLACCIGLRHSVAPGTTGKGLFCAPVALCELAADVHRRQVRPSVWPMNHPLQRPGFEGSGWICFDEVAHLRIASGVLKQDHCEEEKKMEKMAVEGGRDG
jgi:hypothetical protein